MVKPQTTRRRKTRAIPILIVEDNADQWLIIRAALSQSFPEVEPVWLNNAAQAITYLETNAADTAKLPRFIIADLYLPSREDGWALLDFIRNFAFYRKPPVVVISSSQQEEDIVKVYSFGVASYIVKPTSYHDWLNCFYTFRRYWWETVTLPLRIQ